MSRGHLSSVRLYVLFLMVIAVPRAILVAQSPSAGSLEAYDLQYARSKQVEAMLADLLPGVDPTSRITAEGSRNRVLVFGTSQAHRVAKQLIEQVDRPAAPPPSRQTVLKSYPCDHAPLVTTAGQLQAQWAGNPDVRITVDRAAARILVLAPQDVQAAISELLASDRPARSSHRRVPAVRHTPDRATRRVRLEHADLRQIEPILRDIFARRMTPQLDAPAGLPGYTVALSTDDRQTPVRLGIDRAGQEVVVDGPPSITEQMSRLIRALDSPQQAPGRVVRILSLQHSQVDTIHRAVEAYGGRFPRPRRIPGRTQGLRRADEVRFQSPSARSEGVAAAVARGVAPREAIRFTGAVFEVPEAQRGRRATRPQLRTAGRMQPQPVVAAQPAPVETEPPSEGTAEDQRRRLQQLGVDVEVEILPDLDVIILRGSEREVEELIRIIQEIERISAENVPQIEVLLLDHVASESLATVIQSIQEDLFTARQGQASVTPLVKPNALLVIGWGETLASLIELVEKLDQPVAPNTQFRVFRLRHAPAAAIRATIEEFFQDRQGLGTKALVTADVRSNSLIVQASPRDLAELDLLIGRLDTVQGEAVHQLRVFRLKNSLAADIAPVLVSAIQGATAGPQAAGAQAGKSATLELLTIDAEGRQLLKSGLLDGVQVTPDPRTNTLLVSAPPESMDLLAELVRQLDDLPASVAQIKVFRIVNGDAASLVEMLRGLLSTQAGVSRPQLAGAEGELSLAPLRFSVDTRTNAIIASGPAGDLGIVEAILLRLDEDEVEHRKNAVYRLRNAPAINVANAINEFLRSERVVQQAAPGTISPFRQIENEVVVVPEPISNSLIFSATPRFFDEIQRLVEQLDAQPPQVMIEVLIAEVDLNNTDEFGVELGLQDSLLFDRSLLGDLVTTITTTTTQSPGGQVVTTQQETIQAASLTPGFGFNNFPLGNSGSDKSIATAGAFAGQALSHFSVGRVNGELGFGGLVLSAGSESINVLIRALRERRQLRILSRPHIMTLDNQPAFIQVGERVPRITATQVTNNTIINSIDLDNVGLILGVTPRISPDGMVVMEIDSEKSELGPIEEGIPISILASGDVIRSPRISTTTAQTTVSAADGQTVVLGGLITTRDVTIERRVPLLGEIPILRNLFRYDATIKRRTELLIILTPHIVLNEEDAERIKQSEAARMHWCITDVHELQGECGICQRGDCEHCDAAARVIYPDLDPHGTFVPPVELEPVPADAPQAEPMPQASDEPILKPPATDDARGWRLWPRILRRRRDKATSEVQTASHRQPTPQGPALPASASPAAQQPTLAPLPGVPQPQGLRPQ